MLSRSGMLVGAVILIGCASGGKGTRCAPIDPELFVDYGGLYDECTVEQRARITTQPRIDYPYQAPPTLSCLFAEIKVVVDTTGRPLPETVQVTRANDERYLELMLNGLPQLRFAPGRVRGRPVHQIARWETRTAVRLAVSASRNAATRNASC